MKERLIEIMNSVTRPLIVNDRTLGDFPVLPPWAADEIADELIKNGVTLPTFKVGDIVWVYDFMWGIIPCEVDRPYHCRAGKDGECTFDMDFSELDIGDVVFATKEEAELMWPSTDAIMSGKNLYLD